MDISYLSADTIRRTSDLSYCFIFHQEAMEKRPEQTSIQVPNMLDCGHYSVSPTIVPSMITIPKARVDRLLVFDRYSAINAAQDFILLLLHVTTSPGLTAAKILMAILTSIGNVLIFYVFYRVLDRYLARIWNGSDRLASLRRIHKAVISILWLISLAELILYIFINVRQLTDVDVIYSKVDFSLTGVNVAKSLLYLVSSLEVTFWAVFVVVKSRATNLHSVVRRLPLTLRQVLLT